MPWSARKPPFSPLLGPLLSAPTAVSAGATEWAAPQHKPWGQTVPYLRCPAGTLVELCTPMGMTANANAK